MLPLHYIGFPKTPFGFWFKRSFLWALLQASLWESVIPDQDVILFFFFWFKQFSFCSGPCKIRTYDTLVNSQVLWPTELTGHANACRRTCTFLTEEQDAWTLNSNQGFCIRLLWASFQDGGLLTSVFVFFAARQTKRRSSHPAYSGKCADRLIPLTIRKMLCLFLYDRGSFLRCTLKISLDRLRFLLSLRIFWLRYRLNTFFIAFLLA